MMSEDVEGPGQHGAGGLRPAKQHSEDLVVDFGVVEVVTGVPVGDGQQQGQQTPGVGSGAVVVMDGAAGNGPQGGDRLVVAAVAWCGEPFQQAERGDRPQDKAPEYCVGAAL